MSATPITNGQAVPFDQAEVAFHGHCYAERTEHLLWAVIDALVDGNRDRADMLTTIALEAVAVLKADFQAIESNARREG